MKYLNSPVLYLEDQDFSKDGRLIADLPKDKPVVVMIQSTWCGYCTASKPDFQKFAESHKDKVICATIQADGETDGEKKLADRISKLIPNFQGFPEYALYRDGKYQQAQLKDRSVKGLKEFAGM